MIETQGKRESGKRGVSVMVSYVLLVSIVVTLSIIVGGWIYFQAKNPPVGGESCEGVTVSADSFCCYAADASGSGTGGGGTCNPPCTEGEKKCDETNSNILQCLPYPQCWQVVGQCAPGTCNSNNGDPVCGTTASGPSEKKQNARELFLQAKEKRINFTIINTGRFTVQNVLVRVETLPEVGEVFRFALPRNTMPITPNSYTNYTSAVTGMGDGKLRWVQLVPVTSTLCSSQAVDFKLPEECSKDVSQLPSTCP